jgi:hypothetical protein
VLLPKLVTTWNALICWMKSGKSTSAPDIDDALAAARKHLGLPLEPAPSIASPGA